MARLKDVVRHEVTFVVSGCIDYFLSSASQKRGQTFFRYDVAAGTPPVTAIRIPFSGEIGIPVGMTKDMEGNYAQ
jgi:hypothetical protein